jgi:hypothetical protein
MKKSLLILFTAFTGYFAQAQTYYVNAAALGANNGTSWADAFTDLNNALSVVNTGELWVAEGTYYPGASGVTSSTFSLKNNLTLYGGFLGWETLLSERDPNVHLSILSGDLDQSGTLTANDAECVVSAIDVVNTAILDGFCITGGNATNQGGGINFNATGTGTFDPVIKNCNIYGNYGNHGGGVNINNYYLNANLAPKFTNCKIHHNKALGWGGGIRLSAIGDPLSLVSPVFENVLIYADSSQTGGAISYEQSVGYIDATFINCTVANNPGANDLAMQTYGNPGGLTFKNCILNNIDMYATDTIASFNSNFDIDDTAYFAGTNNVYDAPMFINPSTGDYRPGCSSQAVNGGNNAYVTQLIDLAGVTRIIGLAVDMGAYETNYPAGPTVTANANYLAVCDPGTSNLILYGTGALTYTWTDGAFGPVTDSVPSDLYSTTTYTVTGYDANMCADTDVITITYATLPTATAPADYNICATDSVLLQGTASGGTAPYTYEWRDGLTNLVATDNNSYVTLNSYEYFYMYVTDANGCQANDLVEVYVTASANITGTAYINATPIIYGNAYLFRMNVVDLVFDTVAIYPIAGGTYDFGPMPFGNYVLKIDPDTAWHPEAVPTYYGGGFQWDSAMVITHSCLSPFTADVYLNYFIRWSWYRKNNW